jgi:malate dehydrogenase (quinone)
MERTRHIEYPDVALIGGGIMSANLGAILKCLKPSLRIQVYEVDKELAQESSNGWNNAGTGHAGICELSYTPNRKPDGSVNVWKAVTMFEEFEQSKQFWSYSVQSGMIDKPKEFINKVPHMSFVQGRDQVAFLRARYEAMSKHHFFKEMEYTESRELIARWAPLLVEGRSDGPIAATRMIGGTDVNFGVIACKLLTWLSQQDGGSVAASSRVTDLRKLQNCWELHIKDLTSGATICNRAKFVFVGAGGGSLRLLQRSGIPDVAGLGGFPIGGQWLVCNNPEIVANHYAKVYGQALGTAPTMAVPHLDSRVLDGKETLLFGPFAAWTTKFLQRNGRWTDLFSSVRADNVATLTKIGMRNIPLVRYLVQQGTQSMSDRMEVLRTFYPRATEADWQLVDAGIRVQAIKKTDGEAGIVHYGTEVIRNEDRTLSALLGASPGASVSVSIAVDVIKRCLPEILGSTEGITRLKEIIPAYFKFTVLPENEDCFRSIQAKSDAILQLT